MTAQSTTIRYNKTASVLWQLMLGAHLLLAFVANRVLYGTHVHCSHTPTTDGIECRRSYSGWYRQIRAHHTGALWRSTLCASHCADTVQDWCFDLWLCLRYWSCLPQASRVPSLELFTSVSHSVRLAAATCLFRGQTLLRVHRPAKFHHRGSSPLKRTSTWYPLTAQQSPTIPIQSENLSFPTSL